MGTERAAIVAMWQLPMTPDEIKAKALEVLGGEARGFRIHPQGQWLVIATPGEFCGCVTCVDEQMKVKERLTGDFTFAFRSFMIVCPECGNKRCPRANHHDNDCTGSNESGQPGSAYPAFVPHDHTDRVPGCFRCDLSADEVGNDE